MTHAPKTPAQLVTRTVCTLAASSDGPAFDAAARNWSRMDWNLAKDVAIKHGLCPVLHSHLQTQASVCPEEFLDYLAQETRYNQDRVALQITEATQAMIALQARNIPVLALKGLAVNAYKLYPQPWLRPMADADILVPPQNFEAACQTLIDLGLQTVERNDKHDVFAWPHNLEYPHLWSDHPHNRRSIELHHHLKVNPFGITLDPLETLIWHNTEKRSLENVNVQVPHWINLLLHVTLSLTCDLWHKRLRCIKLLDLAQIVRAHATESKLLCATVQALPHSLKRYCFPGFYLASRLFENTYLLKELSEITAAYTPIALRHWIRAGEALFEFSYLNPKRRQLVTLCGQGVWDVRLGFGWPERRLILNECLHKIQTYLSAYPERRPQHHSKT